MREDLIDTDVGPEYLRDRTTPVEIDADEIDPWGGLILVLLYLVARFSDKEPEELLPDSELDVESIRDDLGLTTKYGTAVNIDDERNDHDGG